jgi:magnesium-transporting ATPase (P-type)
LKETFPPGLTNVQNRATISSRETEPTSATATVKVEVVPTPTPEPTPKPELPPEEEGPAAGIFAGMPLLPSVLIGILAIVAMVILAYVGAIAKYSPDKEAKDDLNRQRIALVREGVFLIFIVSAVLILAIGRGIEPDGAISILSAIVGYVFARAARPT